MSTDNTRPEHDLQDERADDAPEPTAAEAGNGAHAVDPDSAAAEAIDPQTSENDSAEPMTMQEQRELTAQLEQAQTKADDYLDSLQRERANFQNYKKRIERERSEQAQTVRAQMLLKLLPVLDDFYRAMDAVPEGEHDQWFAGIELILRRLERYLADHNVTEIEIEAAGQPFDPNYHEAVGVDTDTDAESGTITAVLLRGYMHGDRVLRPAMVRVAE